MAFNFYSDVLGEAYAYKKVKFFDPISGLPAVIKDGPTGVILTTAGDTQLDGNGRVAVYIDTSIAWVILVDGVGPIFKLIPLFLRESADGTKQYIVDNRGFFKTTLLTPQQASTIEAMLSSGVVTSVGGQTGAVTLSALHLDKVDNTRDLDKPVSYAVQSELGLKYQKPTDGIPKTDLSPAVQASLAKADSALQTLAVTSVQGRTGAVTVTPTDLGLQNAAIFTADQKTALVEAPVGLVTDINTGLYAIDGTGQALSLDNQPTSQGAAAGSTIGSALAALAEAVKTVFGTTNQVIVTFDASGGVTFSLPQDIAPTSSPTFATLNIDKIRGSAGMPTVTLGTGAGTGATITLTRGSDLKLRVDLTTGTAPVAAATIFTITFAKSYGLYTPPLVDIIPGNRISWQQQATSTGAIGVNLASTTGNAVVIQSGNTALSASTNYSWNFGFTAQ